MTELLEAVMVICFGLSWPASIIKSAKAKTAKGKSIAFMLLIETGYLAGIIWKMIELSQTNQFTYPTFFYFLNFIMVAVDIALYFRNRRLDKTTGGGGHA